MPPHTSVLTLCLLNRTMNFILFPELMEKVSEHLEELHKAQDKATIVSKFKEELMQKVDTHAAPAIE